MSILHEPLDLVERLIVLLVLEYYCLLVFLPRLGHGSMLRRRPVAGGKQMQVMGLARGFQAFSAAGSQLRVAIGSSVVCLGHDGRLYEG